MPSSQKKIPNAQELKKQARETRFRMRRDRRRKKAIKKDKTSARRLKIVKIVATVIVLALFLFLALMVGDSENHATLIGWAPFVAAVTGVALAFAYIRVMAKSLTFQEEALSGFCERGESIRFAISFTNKAPLFVFQAQAYVFVSDMFGNNASEDRISLALGPLQTNEIALDMVFEHIGTYQAGLQKIVIKDFLGLFTHEIVNVNRHTVNVTPHLQLIEDMEFSNDAMLETTKAAKSVLADSMDYSHVREYVPGDPLKTIHWKLSARTSVYMTKLFEVYTNPGVGIIFDFYAPSEKATELMSMFDAVVESAFSVANYAQRKGMDTEVFFRDKHQQNRRVIAWGNDEMPQLIDDMPRMSNDPANREDATNILRDQVASQYGQNNIVVCSANVDSDLVSMLIEAKLHRRAPMMIAVIPKGIDGRARDAYCAPLSRLDAADIPYMVVSDSNDLVAMDV